MTSRMRRNSAAVVSSNGLVLRDPGRVDDALQRPDPRGGLDDRGLDRRLVGDVEREPHEPIAGIGELGLGALQSAASWSASATLQPSVRSCRAAASPIPTRRR